MKKKILFTLYSYSNGGGAEKILSNIVNNLNPNKYDITIWEMFHGHNGFETTNNARIIKGLENNTQHKIIRMFFWRFRKHFTNLFRNIRIRDIYDIEVSFTTMNPPIPFSKRNSVKKFAYVHGSLEYYKANTKDKQKYEKLLTTSDKIIAISKNTFESIKDVFPNVENKLIKIYNGFNIEEIVKNANEEIDLDIHENSVCVVGRLEKLKGIDKVLIVAKKLLDKKEKVHFYLLGTGNEALYKSMAKKLGIEEYVHFLGFKKNPLKYIKHMSCFLSMSRLEGFSTALVEGLILGIPFVSTDVGGVYELYDNGNNGYMIYNEDEAADALLKVLHSKYDKEKLQNYIRQYSIENQVKAIEDLFDK